MSIVRLLLAAAIAVIAAIATGAAAAPLASQPHSAPEPVHVAGSGSETYVLVTCMVGGVAGFRRLEAQLVERGYRVIVIDPYLLSIDSADVTFAALARRVDAVLAAHHVVAAHVVGHSHGAGVALRLAASSPQRVADLYLLDAGAEAENHGPVLSTALRLAPTVAHMPFGRDFIRRRFVAALRESAARQEWLDDETQRAYSEPVIDGIGRAVAMAGRLATARELESLGAVIARVHVPVTVLLGAAPHMADAGPEELEALRLFAAPVRVERMAGVGHFPHEEAPAWTASLLVQRSTTHVDAVATHAASDSPLSRDGSMSARSSNPPSW